MTGDDPRRLVVIGAAGQMTSVAVAALARYEPRWQFVLCDLQETALRLLAEQVSRTSKVETLQLDLFDASALRHAIAGANFVLQGAGPFHRTAKHVRQACLAARVPCLDIDDDVESNQEAIALDDEAKARGVPLYVGCGASPGFTNVLARDVIEQLDIAESVDVAWCVGDEGPQDMGRAVVEHTMHIGAGPCLTWRNGGPFMTRTFEASRVVPFSPPLGDHRVYEVAHPETVQLPRSFPFLRSVTCWGGLHPAPINGIIRGVALACTEARLSLDDACTFFQAINRDEAGTWAGWREAWKGMRGQNARGEVPFSETLRYLSRALRGKHETPRSGIVAMAVGQKDGKRIEVIRRSTPTRRGSFWQLMPTCTGNSAAAFLSLAADRAGGGDCGTLFPEAWVKPAQFYERCTRFGFPIDDVVSPEYLRSAAK